MDSGQASINYTLHVAQRICRSVVDSGQASINYTVDQEMSELGTVVDSGQASINYTELGLLPNLVPNRTRVCGC